MLERVPQQWRTRIELCFQQWQSCRAYYINKNGFSYKSVYFSYVWKLMGYPVYIMVLAAATQILLISWKVLINQ